MMLKNPVHKKETRVDLLDLGGTTEKEYEDEIVLNCESAARKSLIR